MRTRKQSAVPAALVRLGQRFFAWRKRRARGERIPHALWNSAAKMAAQYGLNLTARTLKLDYYSLKKRMEAAPVQARAAAFVELPSPPLPGVSEYVIEWENHADRRMRVHVKGQNLPDVLALSRSFWTAD